MVAASCELHLLPKEGGEGIPTYPELLMGVCSRWNQLKSSTPSLWIHIDLAPDSNLCGAILTRAKNHVERAGQLPLEIHLVDEEVGEDLDDNEWLCEFLRSVAGRMKTLEFDMVCGFENGQSLVFESLLSHDTRNFTELIIRSRSPANAGAFIYSTYDHGSEDDVIFQTRSFRGLGLDLYREDIEDSFTDLKALHLQGIFPCWGSSAYCNLVDLRLTSGGYWSSITQGQLAQILRECPKLRILHLELIIEHVNKSLEMVDPIHLLDLEVVNLSTFSTHGIDFPQVQLSSMLRLLAPGSQPLRLTLNNERYEESTLLDLNRFLSRCWVVNLCVMGAYIPADHLRHFTRGLYTLVFDSYTSNPDFVPNLSLSDIDDLSFPHLCSWYRATNRVIVVGRCRFIGQDGQPEQLSDAELEVAFPTVTFIPDDTPLPNTTAEWDILN